MNPGSVTRQKRRSSPLAASLFVAIVLASTEPAYAYLDPGSGSMMLQALLGGIAGLAVVIRLYWRRFSERARALFSRNSRLSE